MDERTECGSCHAPIVFVTSKATGTLMPFDVDPVEGGTFRIDEQLFGDDVAVYVGAVPGRPAYRSHFASCPDASRWRRDQASGQR